MTTGYKTVTEFFKNTSKKAIILFSVFSLFFYIDVLIFPTTVWTEELF